MYVSVKKAKLYPNEDTQQLLEKTFGCCRFVYNQLLGESIEAYKLWKQLSESDKNAVKPKVDFGSLSARLTALKKEHEFLF